MNKHFNSQNIDLFPQTFPLIIKLFFIWRILLIAVLLLAIELIPPFSTNYLGGGQIDYFKFPYLFSWANFDGEHYLSIGYVGYKGVEQAFFPVYPILMRILSVPFSIDRFWLTITGIVISNVSFFLSLIYLWKLIKLDYSEKIAWWTILILITFPTSFYFASVYTESLFLLLTVLSFYYIRKNNLRLVSFFGILTTATRVFGILILPSLVIEAWQQKRLKQNLFWLGLIPLGLLSYLIYQWITIGDPLAFYHMQTGVGQQHQLGIVTLPQVFFRYLKILVTIPFNSLTYLTVATEFLSALFCLALIIYGYLKKIRISYLVYVILSFILASITGSFTSLPRYFLVFFPLFLVLAIFLNNSPRFFRYTYIALSTLILVIEAALFFRGYWVA